MSVHDSYRETSTLCKSARFDLYANLHTSSSKYITQLESKGSLAVRAINMKGLQLVQLVISKDGHNNCDIIRNYFSTTMMN